MGGEMPKINSLSIGRFISGSALGLILALNSIAGSAEDQRSQSQGADTFVFFQRAEAHRTRSSLKAFQEVVSNLLEFLKLKNVMLAKDSFRDHPTAPEP
jgi:hypothetical protein